VQKLLAEQGRLDVLVNNAGITRDRSLRKMDAGDWHAVLRADLDSVFNMSKQAIEPMMAQHWGRIVNVSSINGQQGAFGQVNYAAAKAGMHGFTKSLALEMARHGVTVNTVSPGYLRTRMVEAMSPQVLQDKILPQIPVGRLGEPDEVAALIAFLVSNEAGFMTGANIAINGGQHMY
jgi:acetoacetyl-CoA reductase